MIMTTIKDTKKKYGLTGEDYDDADTWTDLSFLHLPEEFIREFRDKVNWYSVSRYSDLSESFIEECKNYVDWMNISRYQKLSEKFIAKFKNKVNWTEISISQSLSEKFIGRFKNYVNWLYISGCHNLTEKFIAKYKKYVDWDIISVHQPLSEEFIRKFSGRVNWDYISQYQAVSKEFLAEFGYELSNNSDKPESFWKEKICNAELYECFEEYFYAYMRVKKSGYDIYSFRYQFVPGNIYRCFSDYSDFNRISFGFFAGTLKWTDMYLDKQRERVIKIKINYEDVTGINSDKSIRCKKIFVIG